MDAYSISVTSTAHRGSSRIYQDLYTSRLQDIVGLGLNTLSRGLTFMDRVLKYDSFDSSGNPPHIGVIGAGLAGLRSADLLLQHGFRVTILEARDRVGGRLHQVKLSNGHLIDIGPNWIHGTEENSIMDLALETETVTGAPSEGSLVYDEDGKPLSVSDGTMCHELMWDIIKDAFQYSNEFGSEIPADRSLLDYFHEKVVEKIPETEPDFERKRRQVLQMSEFWGAFVGSPIERQSLKFFWLEECLDGENLFCAGTYQKILEKIAQPAKTGAMIKYNTKVTEIHGKSTASNDAVTVKTADGQLLAFDEMVLTTPLGWLKQNLDAFNPPLPPRLSKAIQSMGYGCLEKVYISFPKAFWLTPDAEGRTVKGFCQWLSPRYAPDSNSEAWTNEIVELASLDPSVAHPTLLFYTYGAESHHITSTLGTFTNEKEKEEFLYDFFRPYYSRLPSYDPESPDCKPVACFATDWLHDELAGNGSYTNFPVGLQEGDQDILAMRFGVPTEGIWLAGEHTAKFVALGTVTGAYWSGEEIGKRIARAYGRLKDEDNNNQGGSQGEEVHEEKGSEKGLEEEKMGVKEELDSKRKRDE